MFFCRFSWRTRRAWHARHPWCIWVASADGIQQGTSASRPDVSRKDPGVRAGRWPHGCREDTCERLSWWRWWRGRRGRPRRRWRRGCPWWRRRHGRHWHPWQQRYSRQPRRPGHSGHAWQPRQQRNRRNGGQPWCARHPWQPWHPWHAGCTWHARRSWHARHPGHARHAWQPRQPRLSRHPRQLWESSACGISASAAAHGIRPPAGLPAPTLKRHCRIAAKDANCGAGGLEHFRFLVSVLAGVSRLSSRSVAQSCCPAIRAENCR